MISVHQVVGDGYSWHYNKLKGFNLRVAVRLKTSNPKHYTGLPSWVGGGQQLERVIFQEYRAIVESLCGRRKQDWNVKTFKTKDSTAYFYCRDTDWLALLRLHGHNEFFNNVVAIEQLRDRK